MLRKTVTSLAGASVLVSPSGNLWAATHPAKAVPRKKVVTTTVKGPSVQCKRWGQLVIAVKLRKTTTAIGRRRRVQIRILDVTWPVWPDGTFRSVYINRQALPLLREEVLEVQSAKVELISGATDTTVAFKSSLQAALLRAKKA